ncbi:hypothetical protein HK097_008476 [Rhizophlyctis rosea]|uniref:Rad60/SUMO-like domain-containing protein n=1 Tax=Rhizophlyctis rosea TaxID=64517 RepID=A0AAD5SJV7_9FUNG|nr:hypothetical protein HK097_008476 [Rhizophlyctis rosea]
MAPQKSTAALEVEFTSDPDDDLPSLRNRNPKKRVSAIQAAAEAITSLPETEPTLISDPTEEEPPRARPANSDDEEERRAKRPRLTKPPSRVRSELSNPTFDEDALFNLGGAPPKPAAPKRRVSRLPREKSSLSDTSTSSSPKVTSPGSRASKQASFSGALETPPEPITASSDDDLEIISTTLKPSSPRERSKSLTPPPSLPRLAFNRETTALRRELTARGDSFRVEGLDDDETITLLQSPPDVASSSSSSSSTPPFAQSQSQTVIVKVCYKTWPPPANPDNVRAPSAMKMTETDPFSKLIRHVALAFLRTAESDVVLTYNGTKLFSFSTPRSVRMSTGKGVKNEIECYRQADYEAYCEHQEEERRKAIQSLLKPKPAQAPELVEDVVEVVATKEAMVGIKLQEQDGRVHKVRIAKTATLAKLAAVYIEQLRTEPLPAGASVRFLLDGEVLDKVSTLGDHDIDNGDMLEVRV